MKHTSYVGAYNRIKTENNVRWSIITWSVLGKQIVQA